MLLFLPVIVGAIARGAAVIGRFGAAAGRMAASAGSKLGQAASSGAAKAGGALRGLGQAGKAGGSGLRGAAQLGKGPGWRPRRSRMPNQGKSRQFRNKTFSQSWKQSVRRGMRQATQKNRSGSGSQTIQKLFDSKSFLGRITQNFGSAQANFKSGNKLDGVIDSLKVAKDGAKPIGAILAGLGAAAITLATLPKIVKDWSASLIESKKSLGEFNATFSVALGRLDIARFGRNVRLANATGGSFRSLTQSQSRLEEKLLPYQIMASNATLKLVTIAVEAAGILVNIGEGMSKVTGWTAAIEAVGRRFGLNGDNNLQNQPLADLARDLGQGNFQRRHRPPMGVLEAALRNQLGR
jgi:hypothetical protein